MGEYGKILFQNALADRYRKRQWEREMEASLLRYERQQADITKRREQDREWAVTNQITSGFMQLYQNANTPAEKEVIRNNWLEFNKTVSPRLRNGVAKMLGTSPLSMRGIKDAEWSKANSSPTPPKVPMADNMFAWASYYWDSEGYKKQFLRERRGVDYTMPQTIPMDEETYTYLDNAGKVQLGKYEVMNTMANEAAKGTGMSGYGVVLNGGWDRGKTVPLFRTDPDTGIQQQHLMLVQTNVFNGKTRTTPLVSGEAKRGKPDRMGGLDKPEQRVSIFMSYLLSDTKPEDPAMAHSFKRIRSTSKDIFAKYEKDPETAKKALEEVINSELQMMDNRFVYLIDTSAAKKPLEEKAPIFDWNWFKLGEGAKIIPIPGRRSTLSSKDGVPMKVIVDDKNNKVYNNQGKVVGTIQYATELMGSYTQAELESGIE